MISVSLCFRVKILSLCQIWHVGVRYIDINNNNNKICHTAIENLSDPIGYLLDFTNLYYTALAGNMKARAKKDNSFWNHT